MKKDIENILNKPIASATIGEVLTAYKKVMAEEVKEDPFSEYPERLKLEDLKRMTGHSAAKLRAFSKEYPDLIAHKGKTYWFDKHKVIEHINKGNL